MITVADKVVGMFLHHVSIGPKGLFIYSFYIYYSRLPGHDIVMTTVADDGRTLLNNDGKYPRIPSFELFERIRNGPLGHLYPTAGLKFYVF